jgi:hypothetical protein
MPLPVEWTLVPITWTVHNSGEPLNGTVWFKSKQIVEVAGETFLPETIVARIVDGVMEPVSLPATDDPDSTPVGWVWRAAVVFDDFAGVTPKPFTFSVPSVAASVNLAEVIPTTPSVASAMDVAALRAELLAIIQSIDPEAGGGAISWSNISDKPATFPPSTHLHTSTQVSDFVEAVQDVVGGLLGSGSNITLNYDDTANTLSVTAVGDGTGMDPEAVRDAIGIALVGVGNISVAVNDAADTITVSTTATANATDAALRDRATHTGEQAISTVTGLQVALDAKASTGHNHDDRYFTEAEVTTALDGKAASVHTHDDQYYTESEVDTALSNKSNIGHTHDDRYYTETEIDDKIGPGFRIIDNGAEIPPGTPAGTLIFERE